MGSVNRTDWPDYGVSKKNRLARLWGQQKGQTDPTMGSVKRTDSTDYGVS